MPDKLISKRLVIIFLLIGCLAGGMVFSSADMSAASADQKVNVPQFDQPGPIYSSQWKTFIPVVIQQVDLSLDLRFAVIGDYGNGRQNEADVAILIKRWNPDLIITTGDNNYPDGEADTIDENIGQFFHAFIHPYKGSYGAGAQQNRFFPSLGNHDWHTAEVKPYLDYFTLPGNERYYDFTRGPVHFFAIDSDSDEPDGADSDSVQAAWLHAKLSASDSPWKVVYFHHSPYSSGKHGPKERMQWPFADWGADVVISGHDHTYERISRDGILYFVNGLGGAGRYDFKDIVQGSQVRYNADHGAMLVEASWEVLRFQFINRQGSVVDKFELTK
jgi:hypothetical protein